MNYETFKNTVLQLVQKELGEEVTVTLKKIPKNNGVIWQGLAIESRRNQISPMIYLDEFYGWYQEGESIDRIVESLLERYEKGCCLGELSMLDFKNFHKTKEKIFYKLVNYEKNQTMLADMPHIPYLDLAIVFYYRLEEEVLKGATVLIHNSNLKLWNISTQELYQAAEENTPKKLPFTFEGMEELIDDMIHDGEDELQTLMLNRQKRQKEIMYVLTNRDKYFGAACILYPLVMEHISKLFGSSFYILPSSIHECILVPVSGQYSQRELIEMVTEINETQLDPMEVLSNHAYYYDKEDCVITM